MAQLIANPIYDSAFKYMMQNERAATILLENLLDKEILKLDILTNDTPVIEEKSGVRILRLDFSAKVKDKTTGETELVTIELQKSYLDTEIMHFRTYLGQQENIVAIYILGHTFQEIYIPKPVIYNYPDPRGIEKEPVPDILKTRFFRGITHDTIIVQIPYLKRNAKTKLEQMLEIFCQDYVSANTEQLLEIDDFDNRSEEFRDLARPLVYAVSDPQVRKVMTVEDEMSIHFQNVKYVTDENEALHTMIEENRKQLQEKDSQLQEKDSQLQEKDSQLTLSIKMLSELGASPEQIAEKLKISVAIVKRWLH